MRQRLRGRRRELRQRHCPVRPLRTGYRQNGVVLASVVIGSGEALILPEAIPAPMEPIIVAPGWRPHTAPASFQGGNLWAQWHRRALVWDAGDDMAWIQRQILPHLPCGDCRGHAVAYLAANAPTWGDYFAWTVAFHNAVNQRLGKPQLATDQARAIWAAG